MVAIRVDVLAAYVKLLRSKQHSFARLWVSHDNFIEARYTIREMYRETGDMRVDEERVVEVGRKEKWRDAS